MRLEKCPKCGSHLNFSMDYCGGNPVIIYTCSDCNFTTFGEAYISDNKNTITAGSSMATNSTTSVYEPTGVVKKNNGMTTFTVG
jgi:predicted nucleic-acid-binding Zn-ribbon protein